MSGRVPVDPTLRRTIEQALTELLDVRAEVTGIYHSLWPHALGVGATLDELFLAKLESDIIDARRDLLDTLHVIQDLATSVRLLSDLGYEV